MTGQFMGCCEVFLSYGPDLPEKAERKAAKMNYIQDPQKGSVGGAALHPLTLSQIKGFST